MPNQEVMREWVSALRSGKYTQGRGKLSYIDPADGGRKHCCLGVLSDLAVEKGLTPAPMVIPEPMTRLGALSPYVTVTSFSVFADEADVYNYEHGSTIMPPLKVYDWADIPVGDGLNCGPDAPLSSNKLANMNDRGLSFDQIADMIEEEWIDLPEGTEIPDSPAEIEVAEKEDVNA